ncbi:MAG: type III-B CRISPR-associated protein Cas10/Cmr2 [Halothiobacillaceae bacterium]
MNDDILWQTKLAARLHDPAEKALVLLRDPAGHENGTSRALIRLLGLAEVTAEELDATDPDNADVLARVIFKQGLPLDVYRAIQRADWWAAAADRPQWPMRQITVKTKTGEAKTLAVADWAQVNWAKQPILIHPLTKDKLDLQSLTDIEIGDIKQRSFGHFSNLAAKLGAKGDPRKILLAFWRFGPELVEEKDHGKLGVLWELLPADTRVPDHSIWDHLDLTSAFAGAFAADEAGEAALLALSIGPVQGFIAAARKMDDLWAGSHLLSRLAWEAMRPVCEALGPDAILFPRLRGIPQVDLWLRDSMGLPEELFQGCEWNRGGTDANPLFSAALPNRFVAVVPASKAQKMAKAATQAVRGWLLDKGLEVVDRLLEAAGIKPKDGPRDQSVYAYEQMRKQLEGFPEVHWAAVPFSLVRLRNGAKQTELDTLALSDAMAPFFGVEPGQPCGFLDTPAWKILRSDMNWGDGTTFFAPKPGVLYPAVYDLAERVMAAAKAARPFDKSTQEGWRCSLSGEAEWLTAQRAQLAIPASRRRSRQDERGFKEGYHVETLWTRVADVKPAWAKQGEHLSALPAIKRLWPTLFKEEVGKALAVKDASLAAINRFVVSTHTMALAHQLDQWLEKGGLTAEGFAEAAKDAEPVALPRGLVRRHGQNPALKDAKLLPALLEKANQSNSERDLARAQALVRKTLATALNKDDAKLETYYALIMMDGDRMGAILSGDESTGTTIRYRDSFHPQVQQGFDRHAENQPLIQSYGQQKRAISPNRHLAISGALNDFSQTVVRHVVEEEHLGRVIYAGGDDVLAMLPVADLLQTMQRLRHAYSGTLPEDEQTDWKELRKDRNKLHCKNGFAWLNGRLMRMMGKHATASCGAVVAHHQAPLSAVLRELRAAEKRAKTEGGRDAFSITVIKRSGGALRLTAKWGEPLKLLVKLRDFLAEPAVSRRAVYNSLIWLQDLPADASADMLGSLLAYQLKQQTAKESVWDKHDGPGLAQHLAKLACAREDRLDWLQRFMGVAEFLARETRIGGAQ